MTLSLDKLRRRAKALRKSYENGAPTALARLRAFDPRAGSPLKHADFLHVIAREQNYPSWPKLKIAAETIGLDRASKQMRLRAALMQGQHWIVEHLLTETPNLADGDLGAQVALYDVTAVETVLQENPEAALQLVGPRTPMMHLTFSKHFQAHPEVRDDMMEMAKLLRWYGADVNDAVPLQNGVDHPLSALYAALGHANNMVLAQWLLEQGADPNDGESLYHSTELGHHEGLQMLLEHGAKPAGTNALLRALDFNDHAAVQMLINAGARVIEFNADPVGGELPFVIPALHQAARRMCDAQMIDLLLDAGADPSTEYEGANAYAYARVFGNNDLARSIEARGLACDLTDVENLLADAADGLDARGQFIDPEKLPEAFRGMVGMMVAQDGRLSHIRRLVALGVEYDRADTQGMTPVQFAGWEGLPEVLAYFLQLKPDLSHVNGYGGTLLSTIVHGAENCPRRAERDHVACAKLSLEHGVALPARQIELAGDEDMAAFLNDWAETFPGQVIEGVIA